MIDDSGHLTLFRASPSDHWHVLERRDEASLVAPCGIVVAETTAEQERVRVDQVIQAGRTCLTCAEAILKAL